MGAWKLAQLDESAHDSDADLDCALAAEHTATGLIQPVLDLQAVNLLEITDVPSQQHRIMGKTDDFQIHCPQAPMTWL